ncbi:DUF6230 family protein [Streptomyces fulvoviolaceus]|uniref:DUF6230 family protein n=1 Tax=Streptomyces fulvoviolaceus TaxID=285535 RepID=UPI0004CA1B82|nr:DUF6230 family protein [Streptomyces fulvoviolaceus]
MSNFTRRSRRPAPGEGATRWRRSSLLLLPSVAAVAAMTVAMAEGALAASIGVSGQQFKVTAAQVDGSQVAGFPASVRSADGKELETIRLGFQSALLKKLCLTQVAHIPLIGDVTLTLKSGGSEPVAVTDFIADATQVLGEKGKLSDVEVGVDASRLTRAVEGGRGPQGRFGLQASALSLQDFETTAQTLTSGSFTLSGLDLNVKRGSVACG